MLAKIITSTTLAAIALSVLPGAIPMASARTVWVPVEVQDNLESCKYPVGWNIFWSGCSDSEQRKHKLRIPQVNGGESRGHDRGDKGGHGTGAK